LTRRIYLSPLSNQKLSEEDALKKGMEAKAVEFVKQGAEIYKKA
jgi:phosphomethylpyrimidine synthase